MDKNQVKIFKSYAAKIKKQLICSSAMKAAFVSELKERASDFFDKTPDAAYDDLTAELGTPEKIAEGFENENDIAKLKKKAKKINGYRVILAVAVIVIAFLVALAVDMYNTYGGKIVVSEETTIIKTYD